MNVEKNKYSVVKCLLISLSLLLVGCGFQLRGVNSELSARFDKTYLAGAVEVESSFSETVKQLIRLNGGEIVDKADANISVHIQAIEVKSRQVALSRDGATKEYERTYTTVVTLTDLSNGVQLGRRSISTSRFLQIDDRKVLAGNEHSATVKNVAEKDLAQFILRYLTAF